MKFKETNNIRHFINIIFLLFIGTVMRTYHLFTVGFSKPWRFGGLYLEFARQIYQNHYLFPVTIPHYTYGGLPFAYPPLPFYIESFLVFTLGLPEFLIVNLLPPIVSVVSLILFYVLIKKILKNKYSQLISLALFSIFPICYWEQLEGAGLAESFGTMFIILLILAFWNYYQNPYHIRRLLLTSVVWALSVMASPVSAYLSVFLFLTFVLKHNKKKRYNIKNLILHILMLGIIAMLISSIYWGTVVNYHGFGLLVSSFTSQHHGGLFIFDFFIRLAEMNIIDGEPTLSLLFIVALCVLIYHEEYELFLLSFLSVLIPREKWIMGIIGVLMIGYAVDLLLKNISAISIRFKNSRLSIIIMMIIISGPILLRPVYFMLTRELFTEQSIDEEQIEFLQTIKDNYSSDENLIILGNNEFLEWSPYLTEKTIMNVWYGTEFAPSKSWIYGFNDSLLNCKNPTCINKLIRENLFVDNISVIIDLSYMKEFLREDLIEFGENKIIEMYNDRFVCFSFEIMN